LTLRAPSTDTEAAWRLKGEDLFGGVWPLCGLANVAGPDIGGRLLSAAEVLRMEDQLAEQRVLLSLQARSTFFV